MHGILLVAQPLLWEISSAEMSGALLGELTSLPREECRLETQASSAILSRDWSSVQREIEAQFVSKIAPHQSSGYHLFYFGSALIPMAICFGHQVGTWWPIRVFQQHHQSRSWRVAQGAPRGLSPSYLRVDWPTERDRSVGEAVVRISTSHRVEASTTRALVPHAILELELGLKEPSEDSLSSHEEIEDITAQWRRALDLIADQFTGVHTIHLFASVQTGVAFLLGAQISKSKHPKVQTYHYNRQEQPNHSKAILLNGRTTEQPRAITPQEQAQAIRDRAGLAVSLRQLKESAAQRHWAELLPKTVGALWRTLPAMQETPLPLTSVDEQTSYVEDCFSFDPQRRQWQLDERWLSSLARRLPEQELRALALRLLVLHESVHRGPQGLTRTNSQRIGRFAKIVEEMDYLSDVWAMLHELASSSGELDARGLFLSMIHAATETMWAFDDGAQTLDEMQVRRVNRYLIWYWQHLLIEAEEPSAPLARIIEIVTQRPLIELAGPEIALRGDRVYFLFRALKDPEVAIYQGGKLFRHGPRNGFSIEAMIQSIQQRDGRKFRECLRGAFEQTVR